MIINQLKNVFSRTKLGKQIREKRILYRVVFQYRLHSRDISMIENNPEKKENIIRKHASRHVQKTEELNAIIDNILDVIPMENRNEIRQDMLFCYFAYGFTPNEYISYDFEKKSVQERKKYISDRGSVVLGHKLNDIDARRVFMDKEKTYERYKKYYGRKAICIKSKADFEKFTEFVGEYPVFVKKNVFESCGRSVELIDTTNNSIQKRTLFDSFLKEGKIILEEPVKQSAKISILNSTSVNTVRCLTLKIKSDIIIPWCFMKVGRKGSFVDNGGAGGILVGLDVQTGKMNTDGVDECGRKYEKHPDSNILFKGFQLPQWSEMIALCKSMASMEEKVNWIGWDMAHTESGWIVIEGNALSEVIGPQATSGSGIKEQMKKLLKENDFKIS